MVTAPDRRAGRGKSSTARPWPWRRRKRGQPILQPPRIRDAEAIESIRDLKPDLAVLADYGQLVPQAILDIPAHGILNLHPSLLPRHRGASPIPATILAGDAETGVTLIAMDAGLDTGPIVAVDRWDADGRRDGIRSSRRGPPAPGRGSSSKSIGPWLRRRDRGHSPAERRGDADAAAPARGWPPRSGRGRRDSWNARSGPTSRGPARSSRPRRGG